MIEPCAALRVALCCNQPGGEEVRGQMVETARAAEAAPLRRDAVLEAVAFSAERLLLASDWQDVVVEVLGRLGTAADVSRAHLVRNLDEDGILTMHIAAEWCGPGARSYQGDPIVDGLAWEPNHTRWVERMRAGEAIVGAVETFPEEERAALRSQSIVSLAYFPIAVDGELWGCVGFDDCKDARDWSGSDLEGLRTAAALLGAAIARHRQEERLTSAEFRYRSVVERIPAITYLDVKGPDGIRMTFISPQIEALLGSPYERFLEDPDLWFDLVHPEDRARIEEAATETDQGGVAFDEEYRMQHADGHWVWVHDTSTPVPGPDGSLTHFQGFMIDVTRRKEAERLLRDAERRYRSMVEAIPAVVYIDEPNGGPAGQGASVTFVSPQIEQILGYTPERFTEDAGLWFDVMHPDDLAQLRARNAFSVDDLEPFDEVYRMRHADGRWVWVHDTSTTVLHEDGSVAYFQGFMFDVTQRKEAEEQVRVAEERYRAIVETTPAITYQEAPSAAGFDQATSTAYVSPQIEQILGYGPEEWAKPGFWTHVIHPDDLQDVLAESQRTGDSGEPYLQEYRMIARDGRVVWFHDESHLIRESDGAPIVWQGVMVDITERMETEEQLRRAQERLQALIDHMPAVVYVESPDNAPEKLWLSPTVEQLFGYTVEEWTRTPDFWVDRIHADDRATIAAYDERSNRDLEPFVAEYRFRRADGEYVWLHDEAVLVPSLDGPGFWQGFLFDITAQKRAEEQARATERVFRATVENLPAVVYREGKAPDEFYVSPQIEQLFGYTAVEWASSPTFWLDRIHASDVAAVAAANAHADATMEPFSCDYRLRRKDGTSTWVHDEATWVEEPGGEGWWQGFMLDISERFEAEAQLREAEEKFRTIVERNPAVIYTQEFDPDSPTASRTTYISPRQDLLFGYTTEEVLGDPTLWTRTIHPDDRERVLAADVDSNTSGADEVSMEYRMIAKDGRIIWVQDRSQRVEIEGRPPFWQGFLLDITERKQAEEQLSRALEVEREAATRLRALDEMKNTFLQAVSHDLRTPLAAILGLAITLERGDVHLEASESQDLARRIADNARRLDRLVTNLLDLDRLARGIVTPKLQALDVGALVRRVVSESELIADSRLRTEIASVTIPVDGAKIERIVENLLANTVRHTPASSTIWIGVREEDDGVTILVEDDGPGIAADLTETIFEPFRQGPDAPQHSPGVGVGLTLVRRFAELHGGVAWVQEREGGGASFRVFLPAEPGVPATKTASQAATTGPS
jgi:PAS domain S-box-containing protein